MAEARTDSNRHRLAEALVGADGNAGGRKARIRIALLADTDHPGGPDFETVAKDVTMLAGQIQRGQRPGQQRGNILVSGVVFRLRQDKAVQPRARLQKVTRPRGRRRHAVRTGRIHRSRALARSRCSTPAPSNGPGWRAWTPTSPASTTHHHGPSCRTAVRARGCVARGTSAIATTRPFRKSNVSTSGCMRSCASFAIFSPQAGMRRWSPDWPSSAPHATCCSHR